MNATTTSWTPAPTCTGIFWNRSMICALPDGPLAWSAQSSGPPIEFRNTILPSIIITSVLYLTFAARMRPVAGSIRRVAGWTLVYVAVAGTADLLLGTNYGFLRAKPNVATLFDSMPPWPWYIAESFAVGIAAMLILYAPFYLADRVRALGAQGAR